MSCQAYSDAWNPFFDLLDRFWPGARQFSKWLVTDFGKTDRADWTTVPLPMGTWCSMLAAFAALSGEPLLLMQEDFFLTGPVREDLIGRGLEQMEIRKAGAVRLYPSPGANEEYGDADYGLVTPGTRYRISCQATIFRPDYLHQIASQCHDHGEASDLETGGSQISNDLPDDVLAFKRDSGPWPLDYIASAIVRGLWSHDAKRLCEREGIAVDWSRRAFEGA